MDVESRADASRPRDDRGDLVAALAEAREQQDATSEVLSVLGRSKSDLQPLFETVVENASRLCRADAGQIYISDGRVYRLAVASVARPTIASCSSATRSRREEHPRRQGCARGWTIHIPDVVADPDYRWAEASRPAASERCSASRCSAGDGDRRHLADPHHVDPFADRQIELVETFATQGTIAIQNGNLFKQLEARTVELAHSVEELRRSAPSARRSARRSTSRRCCRRSSLTRSSSRTPTAGRSSSSTGRRRSSTCRTAFGTGDGLLGALRADRYPARRDGDRARGAAGRRPQALPDLTTEDARPAHRGCSGTAGGRCSPCPWCARIGSSARWSCDGRRPGPFAVETAQLLETFASQSALAIQNAHLFREIAEKSRRSRWPSAHKSEFLASMSHELRTPLNAVIGFSDVLLEGMFGDLNAKQREYLRGHPGLRAPPARAAQRDPRPVQDRGGPDGARAGAVLARAALERG